MLIISILYLIVLIALGALFAKRRAGTLPLSAALSGIYVVLGVLGYFYYSMFSDEVSGVYYIAGSKAHLSDALAFYLLAAASILLGALMLTSLARARPRCADRQSGGVSSIKELLTFRFAPASAVLLAISVAPLLIMAMGMGVGNVLFRDVYLVYSSRPIFSVGNFFMVAVVPMLGMAHAGGSRNRRFICAATFAVYLLFTLSLSSRFFAFIPMLYIGGMSIAGGRRHRLMAYSMLWLVLLPLLMAIPLSLRGAANQGLLPLPENAARILQGDLIQFYLDSLDALVRNVTFGVPLASHILELQRIPIGYFLASVNPLPSFVNLFELPQWQDIAGELRVSEFVPFSAVGELANQGVTIFVVYFLLIGIYSGWLSIRLGRHATSRAKWGYMIAALLLIFFSFFSTQYNLRASNRFVVYGFAICMLWSLFAGVRVSKKLLGR